MNRVYFDFIAGTTSLGRIEIELFFDITPKTSENFRGLCTGEYGKALISKKKLNYKGTKIFKIYDNQYIIGGDIVYNNGKGGESIYGQFFKDENFTRRHSCAGLLSMNNFGRNTNNSQFIITLKPCPQLDDRHVVFGQIINGMDVLKEISKIPVDSFKKPKVNIVVFDCGDFDTTRLHLREDVFKETIDSIIEKRKNREIIKIMGEKELEEYNRKFKEYLIKNKDKDVYYEDDEESYEENESENDYNDNNDNNENYDLENKNFDDKDKKFIGIKRKKNLSDNDSSSDDEEENELNDNNENNNNNENDEENEFKKRLKLFNSKISEAINLNEKEAMDENKKNQKYNDLNNENNTNKNWKNRQEELKNKLKQQGIPENKTYILNSINHSEKEKEKQRKKEKNISYGWDLFNKDTIYRSNKKRLKNMPFNKELYDEQMKNGINNLNEICNEERKEMLKLDLLKQIEVRKKFTRRRRFIEEANVDYINERNKKFNEKLKRFFGKEASGIKLNLERGTSL